MSGMSDSLDFRPLATYSKFFVFFRLVRRIKMVVVRVFWVAVLAAVITGLVWAYIWANQMLDNPPADTETTTSYSYEFGGDNKTYDISWILPVLFGIFVLPKVISWYAMGSAWDGFAKKNKLKHVTDMADTLSVMNVPSFKGKLLSTSLTPLTGVYDALQFTLFTRQYKEGGLLRWRERQMDTVLTLTVPANLPHVVINAKGNERARRSNMLASYPSEHRFQFEGPLGSKYDVYADPDSRIVALQLFTPDVLQVLYEKLPKADVELQGEKIWIVQRYGILDDELAELMFGAAESLYGELEKQIRSARLMTADTSSSVQ
jgi:hypothetical protein